MFSADSWAVPAVSLTAFAATQLIGKSLQALTSPLVHLAMHKPWIILQLLPGEIAQIVAPQLLSQQGPLACAAGPGL